jgi:hypothetical protein
MHKLTFLSLAIGQRRLMIRTASNLYCIKK